MVALRLHRIYSTISPALGVLFAPTFAEYATRYPGVAAYKLAKMRVVAMYAALCGTEGPPPGLPAMVGVIIDQHMPLILQRPVCLTVYDAYRNDVFPEKALKRTDTLDGIEPVIRQLWAKCSDHGSLRRLLLKGGPFPTSVRYVSAQLIRTANNPETADVVTKMLRLSMLGAYAHSRTIAHPRVRCSILRRSGVDLIGLFSATSSRTSHHYFYLVAEFVMAATRKFPQQWHWVLSHPRYVEYERLVSAASDTIRQNRKPMRIPPAIAPRAWDTMPSLCTFIEMAGGEKKISVASLTAVVSGELSALFKAAFVSTRVGYVGDVLVLMPRDDVVRSVASAGTDSQLRRSIDRLCPANSARLQVIATALHAKRTFTVSAIDQRIASMQRAAVYNRTGKSGYCVLVCACCAIWRSKSSIDGLSRGTIGVKVLHPVGRGVLCNGCGRDYGIRVVNLVGVVVRVCPRIGHSAIQVSLCTHCGRPSGQLARSALNWRCNKCLQLSAASLSRDRLACYVCKTSSVTDSFEARSDGVAITAHTCNAHRPSISGIANVELSAIRRMVLKRKRRYMKRSR